MAEFGYKFNADLKLVTNADQPFAFVSQKHYEKLGDLVVVEIYRVQKEEEERSVFVVDCRVSIVECRLSIVDCPDVFF